MSDIVVTGIIPGTMKPTNKVMEEAKRKLAAIKKGDNVDSNVGWLMNAVNDGLSLKEIFAERKYQKMSPAELSAELDKIAEIGREKAKQGQIR